ncbi:MAG: DUF4249 family protein [candidate division WOR-3 bacterium]
MPRAILRFTIISLFVTGCEKTPEGEFIPKLVVHCLLHTGENPVRAKVNRSYKINEPFESIFSGANIRLYSHLSEWRFEYVAADSYRTSVPVLVEEGDTWFIQVAREGFDTVEGRTVVPCDFKILFPNPGDTVSIEDSMVWTRSPNCQGYFLSFRHIESLDTFYWDIVYPNDSFASNYDPARVNIPKMFFLLIVAPPPDSPPKPCTLRVWALDSNYYQWVAAGGLVAGGELVRETTRLFGGLGVFGSAVERSVPVFVRSATGPAQLKTTPFYLDINQ